MIEWSFCTAVDDVGCKENFEHFSIVFYLKLKKLIHSHFHVQICPEFMSGHSLQTAHKG